MSEEKKALVGSAFAAATQEPKAAVVTADSGALPPAKNAGADQADGNEGDGGQRARNQTVLPGILGKQLRAAYGELLSSPVPDRFNDLIKQLQHREAGDAAAGAPPNEEESK